MKKLIKGSKAAKDYMAKIRAKKSKISGPKESKELKKELAKKKLRMPHGYTTIKRKRKISGVHKDTKSHNVRISVLSGYFDTTILKDLDSLKKEYLKLAKKYHPDAGGTTIQFQELKNEYDKLLKNLLKGSNLTDEQQENEVIIDEAIRNVIDSLVNLENINVELVGKWLWISGNTYPVKDVLKKCGLIFIKKDSKPYWIYKGVESTGRGKMTMDEIKSKYGSTKIDIPKSAKLSGMYKINKTKLRTNLMKLKKGLNLRAV